MCLAIPGKVLSIQGEDFSRSAQVSFGGILRDVSLAYVPRGRSWRLRDCARRLCHQLAG